MSARDDGQRDLEDLFREAMRGVTPLPRKGRHRVPAVRRSRRSSAASGRGARFELTTYGEHLEALAAGEPVDLMHRLQLGDWRAQLSVDLHGADLESARRLVRETLGRAVRAGLECVLIVHGRGLGSPEGPVIKEAVPGWLAEAPHGAQVRAFTTAGRHGGAGGATLVLLGRLRPRAR